MKYTVKAEDSGKRLDAYLAEFADMSRSAAAKLIESGSVTVCGKPSEKKYLVKDGDEIDVVTPEVEEYEALPTSQQQAYFQSFDTVDAFYEWLEKAEANRKNDNTVTGDGSLNLGDYINKNP